MLRRFLSFRVKEYAAKKNKRRYKRYKRLKARNFDRPPTLREYYNYFKYER